MTPKERVLTALQHREPDRIPFDFGGPWTTIHHVAYRNLVSYLKMEGEVQNYNVAPNWGTVEVDEKVLRRLKVDVRNVCPQGTAAAPSASKLEIKDENGCKSFTDEYGIKWSMPKEGGLYYDMVAHPLSGRITVNDLKNFPWPDPQDPEIVKGLRRKVKQISENTECAIAICPSIAGYATGLFELGFWLRGYKDFFLDLARNSSVAQYLLDKLTEMRIQHWDMILNEVGDLIDIAQECDDLGTQERTTISPEMYRTLIKPRHRRVFQFIKRKAPDIHIFLHSCGSIYDVIPDLIEIGVDILNPVQLNAAKMGDTKKLKKEFGKDITFWGGGVDTQVLLHGTPNEVKQEVKRRIDDLAPGGGFVFATVHCIQADVPPENIMAMWEALQEYGKY